MRHGARILVSKWREGVTPNGCRSGPSISHALLTHYEKAQAPVLEDNTQGQHPCERRSNSQLHAIALDSGLGQHNSHELE